MNDERLIAAHSFKGFVCNQLASCSGLEARLNFRVCTMLTGDDIGRNQGDDTSF